MVKNLEQIKDSADVVAIIGRYMTLKRSGANYSGCCPFHDEKSPSFVVSPRKGNYVCYGCGKQGDVIKFLMEYRKMTFVEAIEDIAAAGNITVEYDRSRADSQEQYEAKKQEKERLYDTYKKVLSLIVPVSSEIAAFERIDVDSRTYKRETVENYLLGFHLPFALFNGKDMAKVSVEELVKGGLLKASQNHDGHYEVFANRSIYPIMDPQGRVVAWGGRKQPGAKAEAPKYINSQESPVYQKSKTLYGLYQAQQAIQKQDSVIIVEGYTDVLSLVDAGIKNVVGSCGTAITEDHARLLARYTDNVTLLLDGDLAGLAAATKAVEVLVEHMNVYVCLLPIEEPTPGNIIKTDPDSFIRKEGDFVLRSLLTMAQDAVMWSIMTQWDKEDAVRQQQAIKTAARLLSKMDTSKRAVYLKRLTDRKHMGSLKEVILDEIDVILSANAPQNLWTKQEEDAITKYGCYESRNCYMLPMGDGKGIPLSNFIIKTMTLVVGNRESERIIEIVHSSGHVMQARIESEIFTNFSAFESWIESKGQYYFHEGANKSWNRIRRFVVDRMLTVYPVTKLGWHREGFWVWRKGITSNGQYIPVGPGGIVTHEGVHYLLTMAVSMINEKSDDVGRAANTPYFTFAEHTAKPDFAFFGKQMVRAYGNKAVVGLAYVMATIYRDIIWEQEDYFPLLNIFGMPGSGKNKYFEMLISLWGAGGRFTDLTNTTAKALPRIFAQASNGVTWVDEYRNELDDEILAILTNAYNGSGRSMADYTGGTETKNFDVTNAVIISGEHRPTRRMALYTRCIAQETLTANFDDSTTEAYESVREIAKTGGLTHVLCELLKHRTTVQERFQEAFREERSMFKMALSGNRVEDRLIGNYSVICAVSSILAKEGFTLPLNLDILRDECYKGILHQSKVIGSEDPISSFWRIVAFLYEGKHIQHGQDLIIEDATSVRVLAKKDETVERTWEEPKRLLFLRLAKAHGLYLEYYQRQFRGQGLALGTLEHYLFTNPAYIGSSKGKKFGTTTLRCLVFDLSKIPVQFRSELPDEADTF